MSSLAFAQRLHWRLTAATRIGLIYCTAMVVAAVEKQKGTSVDVYGKGNCWE
jgi:hypothetical protein